MAAVERLGMGHVGVVELKLTVEDLVERRELKRGPTEARSAQFHEREEQSQPAFHLHRRVVGQVEEHVRAVGKADADSVGGHRVDRDQVERHVGLRAQPHGPDAQEVAQPPGDLALEPMQLAHEPVEAGEAGGDEGPAVADHDAGPQDANVKGSAPGHEAQCSG